MNARVLKGKVDLGIITIREDEFAAIFKRFHPLKVNVLYGIAQS